MASTPIAVTGAAVPVRKKLKEALEELQVYSASLTTFSSLLEGLQDHMSFIDRSIEERLRELQSGERGRAASSPATCSLPAEKDDAAGGPHAEVGPGPKLKFLCVNMDIKGLLAFMKENRMDSPDIYKELNLALRAAPDPAALVLDVTATLKTGGGFHANRRSCICLLERLHSISPEIKPAVRERANRLAEKWEISTTDEGDNLEAMAFLQLLVSYGIFSEFEEDDLVELLASISKKKEAVSLCRNLGLHSKMTDIIQNLTSKGKQLDAVKFICASDLADKHPPVPLLKAFMNQSKKVARGMAKNGSLKSQNAAIAKELHQVKAVIKIVEEHKLESEYPSGNLRKRAAYLEKQKEEVRNLIKGGAREARPLKEAYKRPRLSTATTTPTAAPATVGTIYLQPPPLPRLHAKPPHPSAVRAPPYTAAAVPNKFGGTVPHYDRVTALRREHLDLGPPQSHVHGGSLSYPDPRMASGLYDRSGTYASYSLSGGLQLLHKPSRYP